MNHTVFHEWLIKQTNILLHMCVTPQLTRLSGFLVRTSASEVNVGQTTRTHTKTNPLTLSVCLSVCLFLYSSVVVWRGSGAKNQYDRSKTAPGGGLFEHSSFPHLLLFALAFFLEDRMLDSRVLWRGLVSCGVAHIRSKTVARSEHT